MIRLDRAGITSVLLHAEKIHALQAHVQVCKNWLGSEPRRNNPQMPKNECPQNALSRGNKARSQITKDISKKKQNNNNKRL